MVPLQLEKTSCSYYTDHMQWVWVLNKSVVVSFLQLYISSYISNYEHFMHRSKIIVRDSDLEKLKVDLWFFCEPSCSSMKKVIPIFCTTVKYSPITVFNMYTHLAVAFTYYSKLQSLFVILWCLLGKISYFMRRIN